MTDLFFDPDFWSLLGRAPKDQPHYPPYNIMKSKTRNCEKYQIELAVAGFAKEDLLVTLEGRNLRIDANTIPPDPEQLHLHKGISTRKFSRQFILANDVVVNDIVYLNGILTVYLEKEIPEELKAKTFEIK